MTDAPLIKDWHRAAGRACVGALATGEIGHTVDFAAIIAKHDPDTNKKLVEAVQFVLARLVEVKLDGGEMSKRLRAALGETPHES